MINSIFSWLAQNGQIDFGNVLVALVTLFVVLAMLRQTKLTLEQERETWKKNFEKTEKAAQDERKWTQNQDLTREVAALIVDSRVSRSFHPSAQESRVSVIRRAEYLQLRLSPNVASESAIQNAIHELLGVLDPKSDGYEIHQAEAHLDNVIRRHMSKST